MKFIDLVSALRCWRCGEIPTSTDEGLTCPCRGYGANVPDWIIQCASKDSIPYALPITAKPCYEEGNKPMIRTCPHCGEILWNRSPRLKAIFEYAKEIESFTTRNIANHFTISISNANNQLRALEAANIITGAETRVHKTGGIETTWVFK